MFDPAAAVRGLGIFTLLKEIEFAINNGKVFFHLGYTYEGESFYDYKKRFRALERFDWSGGWEPFENFGPY
jgi:arginine-tRNA-protein transferase